MHAQKNVFTFNSPSVLSMYRFTITFLVIYSYLR